MALMEERIYRRLVDETFERIDAAFADADPDLAESNVSQGTLTVVFRGERRLIVTPQPPVRQIWVAFRENAWHFDHDPTTGRWIDDRGRGIDLYRLIADTTRDAAGISITIGS